MSKTKQNAMDAIKNKVRQSGVNSVHAAIIDTPIIEDDRNAIAPPVTQELPAPEVDPTHVDVSVHVDEHVNVNVDNTNSPEPPPVVVEEPVVEPPKKKRLKFEDLHDRHTVWLRKEFTELIEKEAEGERGEKTRIINEALEMYFRKRKRS